MEKDRVVVVSYLFSDLDGIASMYAYSELLKKTGRDADYYIDGKPTREVEIVTDLFGITLEGVQDIAENDKMVLVDTNTLEMVSKKVKEKNVIGIIDHHSRNYLEGQFVNADIQIELVGAAATLVAEKYRREKVELSREAAILLYYGIISNTVNWNADVVTERDREVAKWIQSMYPEETKKDNILYIFKEKSKIEGHLREAMEIEYGLKHKDYSYVIGQLEIVECLKFIDKHKDEIFSILEEVKQSKKVDYVFLNCIDILEGRNVICAVDGETKQFVENVLSVSFHGNIAFTDKMIMRKSIVKRIKEM